jgi:5'-nucleotidase
VLAGPYDRAVRILVTNDDGIDAPGIQVLAGALATMGHEVLVVAPSYDASGSGAALGPVHLTRKVLFEARELVVADGLRLTGYALQSPPALCVMTVILGGMGEFRPDLVVSGINDGANTGTAVLFSGTVGAALTGAVFGISGLAVSVDGRRFETAARAACALVERLAEEPAGTVVNLNVPDRDAADVRGVIAAPLARFGTVRTAFDVAGEGVLELRFADRMRDVDPDSDRGLIEDGWITVTRLRSVHAAAEVDSDRDLAAIVETGLSRLASHDH